MSITRRTLGKLGAGAAVLAAMPGLVARAATDDAVTKAIMEFTGGAEPAEGGIDLGTPEIAENGNTVPIDVTAEGASAVLLLAAGNPSPGVATFRFGALCPSCTASTRIRLAQTQDVIAVAKMADGSFTKVARTVKVTIGGCGG